MCISVFGTPALSIAVNHSVAQRAWIRSPTCVRQRSETEINRQGQRAQEAERLRDKDTETQRHRGTEAQRHRGTESKGGPPGWRRRTVGRRPV
eukprot:COSAG03_NODE_1982_length_3262_cov_27.853304_1_plen_93_part_00